MGNEANPEINITPPGEKGFQLTKGFLELVFEREIEKFSTNAGTNPGDNYLSIMYSIELTFKGDKQINHYLIKCYPTNKGSRTFLDQTGYFGKEYFMYQEFLPQLKQLAAESGVEDVVNLGVAPMHGGNIVGEQSKFTMEPWSNENFILLTDLRKTLGMTMANRVAGLDLEHSKIVLEELAKLHALSWAYKQRHRITSLSDKYPQFADGIHENDDMEKQFKQLMEHLGRGSVTMVEEKLGESHPATKSFKDFMSGDWMELYKLFVKKDGIDEDQIESYLRIKQSDADKDNNEPWLLVTHGDCWINNLLFQYNDQVPKKPVAVTLVDWQINREACPTNDLVHFFFSSIRAPIRIPNQDALLRVYHDAFLRYCDSLQVSPLKGFSMDTLKRRFRRAQYYALVVTLPFLSIALKPFDSEEMAELFGSAMGSDNNALLKQERSQTVLNFYETGLI